VWTHIRTYMEKRVEDPHTPGLAYRWYYATFPNVLERRDRLRQRANVHDWNIRTFGRRLNEEVYAFYRVSIMYDDSKELDETTETWLEAEYVIQLFGNMQIECSIPVLNEKTQFEEIPENVESRINAFCAESFCLCSCNSLGQKRLNYLCAECFTFWYKRTDDCCPICLEDEGRWIKLSCTHVVHVGCMKNLKEKKCPVCRSDVNRANCILNYPFRPAIWY
jgi:hypothetical protein